MADTNLSANEEALIKVIPSDEEILNLFTSWKKESEDYHNELTNVAELTGEYYKGNQTDMSYLANYESHIVENRLFFATESAIPIAASKKPSLQVIPPQNNERAVEWANQVEKVVEYLLEESDIEHKMEVSLRSLSSNRFYVWHPYFDVVKNEIDFRVVPTKNCWFPRNAWNNLSYFIELQEYNFDDFVEIFGKDKLSDAFRVRPNENLTPLSESAQKYYIYAVWTKKWCAYIGNNKVLKTIEQPLWRIEDKDGSKVKDFKDQKILNHFNYPKIPYIIGTIFEDGIQTVGATSLAEQTIPMQDAINGVHRFMQDYLQTVGDPQILIDPAVMNEEEAQQLSSEPGRKYIASGIANENLFRRAKPPEMPQYVRDMLVISQQAFDNIYGTHASSRGERSGSPTLGQDTLMKQADTGRIEAFAKVAARTLTELGNWYIQLMMIYYDEKRDIPVLNESDELIFVEGFSNEMILEGVKLRAKPDTALPDDKVSRASLYLQLAQMAMIRPLDLYKGLGLPDPETLESNLIQFNSGQVMAQTQAQTLSQTPQGAIPQQPQPAAEGTEPVGVQ